MSVDVEPDHARADAEEAEAPPFLGTWGRVYSALMGLLVFYTLVFAWLSRVGA